LENGLRLWQKQNQNQPQKEQRPPPPERVQKLAQEELILWFDTTLLTLHAAFDKWRFHGAPMEEWSTNLESLMMLHDEIKRRDPK
jgi:hypothetical protein